MKHTVIIGNGISGVTTARYLRKKSDEQITIISGETDHFFSRTALMYIYMGHMKFEHTKPYEDGFWKKNRLDLVRDWVVDVDFDQRVIRLQSGKEMTYDRLVLALGSKPNKFGWPGQDLPGVQGLYSFQDLETLEANTHAWNATKGQGVKRAVIVGGGLIGVEMAEMLLSRDMAVTFLVRENRFWGNVLGTQEGEMIARHMVKHHVDLRLQTELKEILADEQGRACAVITGSGERIDCSVVGLTAGVSPNIDLVRNTQLNIDRGILVDPFLETNIKGVYALGDCAQFVEPPPGRRPIEQVWYTGKMMGKALAETLSGNPTRYAPGPWFNSAKFFDIEYQTYGEVPADPRPGEKHFWWVHEKGEIGVRVVFEENGFKFLGINTFGIRMRHNVMDRWLREERSVHHVLQHLKDAHFDPEFYRTYEEHILAAFNAGHGTQLQAEKKNWKRILNLKA
ncbi:MAG: NAD(P)/FAD-dependent oxidoreductase [Flavobacteriales bacterium]|nr:NAD(P)/FAD-dependent oxidoreductase [Flavobacteriales bacterium]